MIHFKTTKIYDNKVYINNTLRSLTPITEMLAERYLSIRYASTQFHREVESKIRGDLGPRARLIRGVGGGAFPSKQEFVHWVSLHVPIAAVCGV